MKHYIIMQSPKLLIVEHFFLVKLRKLDECKCSQGHSEKKVSHVAPPFPPTLLRRYVPRDAIRSSPRHLPSHLGLDEPRRAEMSVHPERVQMEWKQLLKE